MQNLQAIPQSDTMSLRYLFFITTIVAAMLATAQFTRQTLPRVYYWIDAFSAILLILGTLFVVSIIAKLPWFSSGQEGIRTEDTPHIHCKYGFYIAVALMLPQICMWIELVLNS